MQTEAVQLRTTTQVEDGAEAEQDEPIQLATLYYLVQEGQERLWAASRPPMEQVLDRALQRQFPVDPVAT